MSETRLENKKQGKMIEFTSKSIIIFNIPVHYYGIIVMLGVIAAASLGFFEAKRKGMNTVFILDSLVWVIIGGIIGARIWHILTPPASMVEQNITTQYYLSNPLEAISIWKGGLGIPGGIIGGMIAGYILAKRQGESFLEWVDIAAVALPLGQAIGRWGNYVNQELYGAPTNLPWAIFIEPGNRLDQFKDVEFFHPIFLYESLWNLASVFFLIWITRRYKDKLLPGDVFLIYMVTYPVIRIVLDFVRLDVSKVAGVNANQVFMAAVLVFAGLSLFFRHRVKKKEERPG